MWQSIQPWSTQYLKEKVNLLKGRSIITPESIHDVDWDRYHSDFEEVENLPRIKIASKWVNYLQPKTFLDIGCGPGYLAKTIKKTISQIEIHGIDFSQVAIEHAEPILDKCWCLNLDTDDIPSRSDSYDAIVCLEVMEHVYDADHILHEIRRVLKPNGRVLISVPNLAYWRYRLQLVAGQVPHGEVLNAQHIRVYNLSTLKNKVSLAGMKVEKCWGYGERMQKLAYNLPKLFSSTLFVEATRTE
jgi:2-polyprenyl-3-methyl-5-hydroxy-6-metoxy-1,4-benzoquinol methylase